MFSMDLIVIRESSTHHRQFDITPLSRLLKGMTINPRLERDDEDADLKLFEDLQITMGGMYQQYQSAEINDESYTLGMHAQRMWTAAVSLIFYGQYYAAVPILRTALESIGYALLIAEYPEKGKLWSDRNLSDEALKASKNAFKQPMADARDILNSKDEDLGKFVYDTYLKLIDEGAHPNPKGVAGTQNLYMNALETIQAISLKDAYPKYHPLTIQAIILSFQVGIGIYRISTFILDAINPKTEDHFKVLKSQLHSMVGRYNALERQRAGM